MCAGAWSKNEQARLLEPRNEAGAPLPRDARKTKARQRRRPFEQFSLLRRLASHQEEMAP